MNFARNAMMNLRMLVAVLLLAATARGDELQRIFRHPPESAKPLVYWFWMGRNVTAEGITGDLETLKAAGFGGTTMCNLGDVCTPWPYEIKGGLNPDMVPYVSASWWKLVRHAAAESRRLGLDFGIHNCPGYESNGGPWIPPQLSMQELCFSQSAVAGPARVHVKLPRPTVDPHGNMAFPVYNADSGQVEKPEIPARKTYYRDIAVLALPAEGVAPKAQVLDLTNRLAPDGALDWNAPAGKWIVYRFGHTTMGTLIQPAIWKATGLECDKMNPEAVAFHTDHVLGEIKKHLGNLAGNGLKFLWFDSYEAGTPSWTPKMREEFKARRGYDLTPFLPAMATRVVGSPNETDKFRADFRRTIADLYRDVNFEISNRKAHAAGLGIQSEPYGGPWIVSEVVPKFDEVAGEFWNQDGRYGPYAVADVVAGTRLAGRNIINAEAFTAGPGVSLWNETPAGIKSLGDAAYCDGVNRLMLHRFTHEPWNDRYKPGVVMGQWGTHFDRTQTWWEPGKALVQYWQRCQAMLQWGRIAPTDFAADGQAIRSIHRHGAAADVWFVANLEHATNEAQCAFAISGKQPELWDPVTGTIRDLGDFEDDGHETTVSLEFASNQSWFIVFRKPVSSTRSHNFPILKPTAEVTGPWHVSFDPKWGGPADVTFEKLGDWTKRPEPGIRYYSGTATYHTTFDGAGAERLELGLVNHVARVRINGRDLGVVWTAPWSVSIPAGLLKPHGNRLEIEVTNVWANRLIGDEQEPPDCEWLPGHMGHGGFLKQFPDWFVQGQPRPSKGRYCFTTWNYFTKDSPLVSSGLLGPVRLLAEDWTTPRPTRPVSPVQARTGPSLEADVVKEHRVAVASAKEEGLAHDGGGSNADSLFNGTTHNGSGGEETLNDGKTFRGYGAGSSLTLRLAKPSALTEIRTFAGHRDGRASQAYTVLIAKTGAPTLFEKLATGTVRCEGGASELRVKTDASDVVAIRFEFQDGPLGFNVYREISLLGKEPRR
jgi:hypothetical protein